MLGNMLAGTDEAPGERIEISGKLFQRYEGSSTYKPNHVEGVAGLVPYKGPVKNVVEKIMDGIRSGMSYQGVSNLEELKENPEFVQITNAGLTESKIHDIKVF
jgi:IMP dehydrogenase